MNAENIGHLRFKKRAMTLHAFTVLCIVYTRLEEDCRRPWKEALRVGTWGHLLMGRRRLAPPERHASLLCRPATDASCWHGQILELRYAQVIKITSGIKLRGQEPHGHRKTWRQEWWCVPAGTEVLAPLYLPPVSAS